MLKTRSLALAFVMLGLIGSQADAAARRGGWYQWWLKQNAARSAAIEALAASGRGGSDSTNSITVTPAVIPPPVAASPQPSLGPITTGSLFGGAGYQPPAQITPTPAPETVVTIPATTIPTFEYDALLNFSDGPYAQASLLTTGNAQPWYTSPVVQNLYGGIPDVATREAFTQSVLEKVESTYAQHGLDLNLTTDPSARSAHSMSVVAGTSYGPNPNAIGITDMGNDGFTFIDKLTYPTSTDQLEWAVANNISHELMHAFNVEHHSTDGGSLDAAVANWDMLISPNASFGAEAVADLASQDFQTRFAPAGFYAAQDTYGMLTANPVPEPTTLALWGLAGVAGLLIRRRQLHARSQV